MERATLQLAFPVRALSRALRQPSRAHTWTCGLSHAARGATIVSRKQIRHAATKPQGQSTRPKAQDSVPKTPSKARRLSGQEVDRIRVGAARVLNHPRIPSEQEILVPLREIEAAARELVDVEIKGTQTQPKSSDQSPFSALLSLDAQSANGDQSKSAEEAMDFLSRLAFDLLQTERVYITPDMLSTYVNIQSLLGRPWSLPEVFELYANKPVPVAPKSGATQITFSEQSPDAVAAAIPSKLAKLALDTAVRARDFQAALGIISTTYGTTAFRRSKAFRQALPPSLVACLAPVAAWSLASNLASMQSALPAESYASYAFAAMTTYVLGVGSIGYVALTTRNDQMERVTWVIGTPLWERWIREEERAACDKVALAWGFRQKSRWGEEEGEQWHGLKEWLGIRGMILDKVGLMEGME